MKNLFRQLTNSLLVFSFLLSVLGQLGRVSPFPGVHFYVYEPFFAAALLLLIVQLKTIPFQKIKIQDFSTTVCYFLSWTGLTLLFSIQNFSGEENSIAFFYFLRLAMYSLAFPYVYTWFLMKKQNVILVNGGLYAYFLFMLITAFIQYFYYPNLRNLMYAGWDPHYYRVFGMYLEPVIFAAIAGLFMFFFLIMKRSKFNMSAAIVSLIGVIATFSRGVFISLPIALTALYGRKLNWKYGVVFAALVAGIVFILPKPSGEGVNLLRTSTIESRREDYAQGIEIFLANPLFGIGYNHIAAVKETESSPISKENNADSSFHSSFLIILVTTGIIGFLFYVQMVIKLMKVNTFFMIGGIFLMFASLFDNLILHPFVLITFLYLGSAYLILLSDT